MNLDDYDALSFDCYGTLIDWETGIAAVLAAWARQVGLALDDQALLTVYGTHEAAVEREMPTASYPDVIASAFRRAGEELAHPVEDAWAERLGASVPDWPAFDDSAQALASLAERYQLIIVSNVHRDGFAASSERLGVQFDKIITAQDVGAYKPAENHFKELEASLGELGIAGGRLLHVAQSLFHDHVPAQKAGLPTVWINRRRDRPGWGATPAPSGQWRFDFEFASMREFAEAAKLAMNH